MALVERIKNLAAESSTNIKTIEKAVGLGNGTIRRWDESPPSADKLLRVANMLNTSMDYLMTGNALFRDSVTIDPEDAEILVLLQQLPHDAKVEFRGEIKGYIKGLAASGESQEVRQAK